MSKGYHGERPEVPDFDPIIQYEHVAGPVQDGKQKCTRCGKTLLSPVPPEYPFGFPKGPVYQRADLISTNHFALNAVECRKLEIEVLPGEAHA